MKLRLTVDTGTLAGKSFELQSGFLTIGRGENCSIRFDPKSERIASKQHAFVEARSDGFYLTDNKSLNGTLLNGKAINRAQLTSGDKIQFGRNGATASVTIQSEQVRAPDSRRSRDARAKARSRCRHREVHPGEGSRAASEDDCHRDHPHARQEGQVNEREGGAHPRSALPVGVAGLKITCASAT